MQAKSVVYATGSGQATPQEMGDQDITLMAAMQEKM